MALQSSFFPLIPVSLVVKRTVFSRSARVQSLTLYSITRTDDVAITQCIRRNACLAQMKDDPPQLLRLMTLLSELMKDDRATGKDVAAAVF